MDQSADIKETSLYLFLRPWNKATYGKTHKHYKLRLHPPAASQTRFHDMISLPKLLLAIAIFHGLASSGYLVPAASSVQNEAVEETEPLLKKWEPIEPLAAGTDMAVRDDSFSDVDFTDNNSTGKLHLA
jgi:hypothetical protein